MHILSSPLYLYTMDIDGLVRVLFGWLPLPGQSKHLNQSLLEKHCKVQPLSANESVEEVFSIENILSKDCILLPGHLVRVGMLNCVVT